MLFSLFAKLLSLKHRDNSPGYTANEVHVRKMGIIELY
jgi:hypothetical protein